MCVNSLFCCCFSGLYEVTDPLECGFGAFRGIWASIVAWFWMMSEQDLADVVQIAVEDLNPDHPGTVGG